MRRPRFVRATLVITLLTSLVATAQDVTEPALKAAFIYNFISFTEWPEPFPVSDPLVLCVVGDAAVGNALERVVKGRAFAGRRMTVSLVAASGPMRACRMLYLSGMTASQVGRLVAGLQDSPVLTISDVVGFTAAGGMMQFFFERGQLRFSVGLEAVKRSGLQMSSRLLVLAKRYEPS
jgi:hypothetical protein